MRGAPRACVCGYKADDGPKRDLTVHFVLGDDGSGVRCTAACYGCRGPEKKKKRGGERKGKKRRNLAMAR